MKSYFSVGLVETKIAIDLLSFQAQPGGVVGYQYTPFFPPRIPIYLKTAKKVDTKYLKLLPKRHVRQQRLV